MFGKIGWWIREESVAVQNAIPVVYNAGAVFGWWHPTTETLAAINGLWLAVTAFFVRANVTAPRPPTK